MTCEIAIMNRHAIALAADSAMTVTRLVGGKEETRSFKGSNKIFQLSSTQPVAVMIFDTASLHEVPWDIIVKDFRNWAGDLRFGSVRDYAIALFQHITTHYELFPRDYQISVFKREAIKVAEVYYNAIRTTVAVTAAGTLPLQTQAVDQEVQGYLTLLAAQAISPPFSQQSIDDAHAQFGAEIGAAIESIVQNDAPGLTVNVDEFARLTITALFVNHQAWMTKSGIVVAGYGDDEYFPAFYEFACYGFLLGYLSYNETSYKRVERDRPGDITSFATNEMVTTFLYGMGNSIYGVAGRECKAALERLRDWVVLQGTAAPVGVEAEIQAISEDFSDRLSDEAHTRGYWPTIRVIAALPLDEMAELAESLVMVESLKEKVTRPTESVSGPIDVAVITKHDGFIWIKRKHYFDPALNPRYFSRQALRRTV